MAKKQLINPLEIY